MNELPLKYEGMTNGQLVNIIKSQNSKLIRQEAVIKKYKKHLEQVIEFSSVEKYRETVKRNRGAAGTTPLDN
ncbi:hypothetical protein [Candidatus Enterococcus ikei]|uniref:Uncharacterized protein n=1 Tax=Candidatus Enterococcus ikei TaxID=2815326 RepID=A0ABS3GYQ4_9ENTE|nr:hypothetical protein [Enterococcus sp. DIV0869a]MBO0439584.1 hypothetical protein [Enterococcus sp. DIV0869a]